MKRGTILILAAAITALIAGSIVLSRDKEDDVVASLTLAEAMGGDTAGYARVRSVRTFTFPADHGPHPNYKTEWWYYTGNLEAETGRHFGYQFTIFRLSLTPPNSRDSSLESAWKMDQLYMAHFTLTDVSGDEHHAFERLSRGAAGLAGAQSDPFRVWLENWSVEQAGELPAMRIKASAEEVGVDLTLKPVKPIVLQGDRGYDRKGHLDGNASYYYSITRMSTNGTIHIDGEAFDVNGFSWMDREWSTSALDEDQVGWDWFSLQLSNGWDLMYYQIREEDGGVSPFSDGILVGPSGEQIKLLADDVKLEVLDQWSNSEGAEYPAAWRLAIPREDLELNIQPYVADQELDVSVRYWEGAVRIEGTVRDSSITGDGYVELTGYEQGERGGGRSEQNEAL